MNEFDNNNNVECKLFNLHNLILWTDKGNRNTAKKLINVYPGIVLNNKDFYDILTINKKGESEIRVLSVEDIHSARTMTSGVYIQFVDNAGQVFYIGKQDEEAYNSPEILVPFNSIESANDHWKYLLGNHKIWLRYNPVFIDSYEAIRRYVMTKKIASLIMLNNAIDSILKKQLDVPVLSGSTHFNELLALAGSLEITITTIKTTTQRAFL